MDNFVHIYHAKLRTPWIYVPAWESQHSEMSCFVMSVLARWEADFKRIDRVLRFAFSINLRCTIYCGWSIRNKSSAICPLVEDIHNVSHALTNGKYRRYLQLGPSVNLSQVLEADDIFTFWMDISEIIRVKTPSASPWLIIDRHTDYRSISWPLHRFNGSIFFSTRWL